MYKGIDAQQHNEYGPPRQACVFLGAQHLMANAPTAPEHESAQYRPYNPTDGLWRKAQWSQQQCEAGAVEILVVGVIRIGVFSADELLARMQVYVDVIALAVTRIHDKDACKEQEQPSANLGGILLEVQGLLCYAKLKIRPEVTAARLPV